MKTYVGTDGKLHFVNSAGADTVLTFSNSDEITYIEIICLLGWGDRNSDESYASDRMCVVLRDTNSIGDQTLLSGSLYYSSGWRKSISVKSEAVGYKDFSYTSVTPRTLCIWGRMV